MPGCLLPWIWSPHLILYLMDLVPISSVLTLYWHDLDRMEHAETDTEAPSLQLVWIWFDLLENIIRAHSWVEQRCITPLVFIVTCLFVTSFGWCLMFNWPDNELFVWMAHVIRLWIVTSCMFPPAITKCHISWHDTMLHWCSYITHHTPTCHRPRPPIGHRPHPSPLIGGLWHSQLAPAGSWQLQLGET